VKLEDGNTTQEEDDGLSDNFDCNERNYKKEGEVAQPKEFVSPMNYFYQLPLAPNSSRVPLAPILGTSPKLNLKLNLKSNHVLEAPTTMQSYCIGGDENAPLRLTCDENTPPRLTHLGSNSMPKQGYATTIFQQSMHRTLDCTKEVAKGNDDLST
jgi:hypothetical protein